VVTKDYPDIEDQIAFVAEGQGAMPAFGPGSSRELTEEELRAVVEYTRELGG
jgi:mono/diheme cytochrome c family protein